MQDPADGPQECPSGDDDRGPDFPEEARELAACVPERPSDDEPASAVSFQDVYDRLQASPKDAHALAAVREWVIGWARKHGFADEADDIAQDVLLALIRPRGPFDVRLGRSPIGLDHARGRETFKGFVFGYFRNACKAVIRHRVRRRATENLDDLVDLADPSAQPDLTEEGGLYFGNGRVSDAMEALEATFPTRYRALDLRVIRQMEYAEVAKQSGTSEANCRQHVTRALKFLREYLGGTDR